MGVKHFYYWYSRAHKSCISRVLSIPVDTLCIDMNGIFHGCAQKVYRYGDFAASIPLSVFERGTPISAATGSEESFKRKLFREVCDKTDMIVRSVRPTGTLLLFVDGVAGLGKMNQQRQRRFRSCQDRATERSPAAVSAGVPAFNPNQFTPGTALMDGLTKAIDVFIRRKQASDPIWRGIRVILSNEKVPGEGEHKIMEYLRKNPCPSACIYGMDGDLMMLAALLPVERVFIARETDYYRWEYVDVEDFIKKIIDEIDWTREGSADYSAGHLVEDNQEAGKVKAFCNKRGIRDFVMMCFLVGNDFLPTTPALSIIDGGLTLLFQVYRSVGRVEGHLTGMRSDRVVLSRKPMMAFLTELARHEKTILERKYNSGRAFHHDPIIVRHSVRVNGLMVIDMDAVADEYYSTKFADGVDRATIARQFLDGIIWVMNYYEAGMPDWLWCFPHLFGPFIRDLADAMPSFRPRRFDNNDPVDPMLQLMMVLPPSDQREMLPAVLHMMDKPEHKKFFPDRVEIDMSGKKKDWEGIPIVPFVSLTEFNRFYTARKKMIPITDARRNIRGKTFAYLSGECVALN